MTPEAKNEKRVFFYHQQRIFWPLLTGFITFLLAQNKLFPVNNCAIPAFIAYVATGLFYDWLVFTYLGYKDSQKLTPEQWELSNIKAHEADKINEFFVMVRRCAVAASVSAISISTLFFPQASIMGTFFFAYTGITILFISIGMLTKEIVFKYTAENVLAPPKSGAQLFSQVAIDPSSDNPALNPLWYHRQRDDYS